MVYEFFFYRASKSRTVLYMNQSVTDSRYIPFHLWFERRYEWRENRRNPLVFIDFGWSSDKIKRDDDDFGA
jgi:hypothetical protein